MVAKHVSLAFMYPQRQPSSYLEGLGSMTRRGQKVILKLSPKEVNEDQAKMKLKREKEKKRKKKRDEICSKDYEPPKQKNERKEIVKNKERLYVFNLPASFTKMLESFQGLFLEEIPHGLPPIRG
ncbi:hypothetical protein CR513_54481, partial [Mucuna pruriens]